MKRRNKSRFLVIVYALRVFLLIYFSSESLVNILKRFHITGLRRVSIEIFAVLFINLAWPT